MTTIDTKALRNAFGSFPTGVCVVTTHDQAGRPFGMTVNSFSSVSLEPALVLWSLQRDSDCYGVFEQADAYCVNILAEGEEHTSNTYATKDSHILSGNEYKKGKSGLAVLDAALASFECKIWQRYDGGDHIILVGEVLHYHHDETRAPLLFHAGAYGKKA